MLYDPKWDKQITKADPFSLSSLIAWLEMQPADREYNFIDVTQCLLTQYFRSHSKRVWITSNLSVHYKWWLFSWVKPIPKKFFCIALEHPQTFGAALERARKALAAQ